MDQTLLSLTSGHPVEEQVLKHKEVVAKERQVRVNAARATEELEECVCCYSDEVSYRPLSLKLQLNYNFCFNVNNT